MVDAPRRPKMRGNPYVGPRPFRDGEAFYGREREASGLLHNLLAARILLLYAPSGAGKTSLIQAAIVPEAEKANFQICAHLDPRFTALRVNAPPPDGIAVKNRYVYSAVQGLVGHLEEPSKLADWTVSDALDVLARQRPESVRQMVFIDQLEEVLNLDPTDVDGQHEFFRQLGLALDDPSRWALLAIREDYMGGLDRYARHLPGQLRSTFRLDLLEVEFARRAIQRPAADQGVEFTDAAVELIIKDLSEVLVQSPDADPVKRPGHFVEPVLLQAVCDGVWRDASGRGRLTQITEEHVRNLGQLDAALGRYYETVMRKATGSKVAAQQVVRNWVEQNLITEQGFRSQTRNPPPGNSDKALETMKERYLVRDDPRPNGTWLELAHDRLVDPILKDNAAWRETNLLPWQCDAWEWHRHSNDRGRLLSADAYLAASQSSGSIRLLDYEKAFLDASSERAAARKSEQKLQNRMLNLQALLMSSLVANIALLIVVIYLALK